MGRRKARRPADRIRPVRIAPAAAALAALICAVTAAAQQAPPVPVLLQPDTVLVGGKIVTMEEDFSLQQALAVRDGKIVAAGDSEEVRALAGPATRVVDLGGRTVVPGLIDSHMHAIRAALSFSYEVNWIGAESLTEALGRIGDAAAKRAPGAWLIVAGGWNPQQFAENRRPTQAELEAAAPDNPVYVQLGYGWALMSDDAFEALDIRDEADLPAGGRIERDADARPLAVSGDSPAIVALFDLLPKPTHAQQVAGTKAFFRELNRLGLTGVGDPGGNNLLPRDYRALFDVWRSGESTLRVTYSLNGQEPGAEFEELQSLTAMLPMGFGDDMLRFNGLGERVTTAMYNNPSPSDADRERFYEIARWAAARGMAVTVHWGADATVGHLLSVFERVDREIPIRDLRWSIAHLNDASAATLSRMAKLGVGWTVQDAMYFGGEAFLRRAGREAARRAPPVVTASRLGVEIGAGTDAHRVASYDPFTALQWFLDGRTVGGLALRGPEETPSRAEALRFYTLGSAWFSHDEDVRGSLEPGKLADLAVLSADYLTVPVEEIGAIESLLTMVGGRIVYASGPFAELEER
ncbi:MAG: amidohydrolase [Gammaproteobacteria bacterium]|nr:amidohydrolase [Gammaproteobacteria bacterium]